MEFLESNLKFTFDDNSWSDLIQYDKTTDCRNLQHAISGTKAVDFIGVLQKHTLTLSLFEVKNFREHRIENKARVNNGELIEEFAQKVRDTMAGIVGGAQNSSHLKVTWKKYIKLLSGEEVHVVCWIEEDRRPNYSSVYKNRHKAKASGLVQEIKRKLSWLTTKVMVADTANNPYKDTLQVSFINADPV
jgi:ribosomal protein L25 (general stress protein Ctc)